MYNGSYHKYTKHFSGFTLVELMVVISIISLLMSIMLPGLGQAREVARRLVCASNMRSLNLGWIMYSHENDDSIVSANTQLNDGSLKIDYHWVSDGRLEIGNIVGGTEKAIIEGALARYLDEATETYKCKSDKTEMVRSYSISNTMNGYDCGCKNNCPTPYGDAISIRHPASSLVFIDADSNWQIDERAWIAEGFCPMNWDKKVWNVKGENNITARHLDGCNMSYADGHVGSHRWRDNRTIELANWNFSYNDTKNNKDLDYLIKIMEGPMDR